MKPQPIRAPNITLVNNQIYFLVLGVFLETPFSNRPGITSAGICTNTNSIKFLK